MPGYITHTGNYDFGELGIIYVRVRRDARRVSARWRGNQIIISAFTNIEYDQLKEIIRGFMPKLQERKPDSMYYIGQVIEFTGLTVTISSQSYQPDRIFGNMKADVGHIDVGTSWDITSHDTERNISKFLCRMAQAVAPGVLIPRARQLAAEVGKSPMTWSISNGHRTLGLCNANGEISLSYALIFYPDHLRDYVIYHELAHLTELNHSSRFHEVCDAYCQGREQQLVQEIKAYRPPIIR